MNSPDKREVRPAPFSERLQASQEAAAQKRVVEFSHKMKTTPYQAKRRVEVPGGEIPLIDGNDPESRQVQERMVAHVQVFDLSNDEQVLAVNRVWQKVCDGEAIVSTENITFDEKMSRYLMLLRWSEYEYKLPGT